MVRSGKHWRDAMLALGCAALLFAVSGGCASQGPDLPEFPHYAAADDFLAMQARLQAFRPPDPRVYVYSEHNQSIYQSMQEQERQSQAAVKMRERMQQEWLRRHRNENQGEWEALQRRLARDEAYNALREQDRAHSGQRNQATYARRFRNYRDRLEQLARQKEEEARQQQINAYRNQQQVEQRISEMRKRQVQNLALQGTPPPKETGAATPPTP
ncbi:MAG TPA: hypothetical protein VKB51_03225 [bacterium]|nr:hypothetical protein [bacterium]